MGADFKEKIKGGIQKCWDKAAVAANTPDLFAKTAERQPRLYEAKPLGNHNSVEGEVFCARIVNDRLIGFKGMKQAIVFTSPPQALIDAVGQGCGVAKTTIMSVDTISGMLEVAAE
jgi:hypothetical protein